MFSAGSRVRIKNTGFPFSMRYEAVKLTTPMFQERTMEPLNNKPYILVKRAIQAFFQNTGLIFTQICLFSLVNLSDPATEDAVYDSYAMRKFTGIDFLKESVPDETTLCKFRHLLEVNGLNKLFFEAINRVMVQSDHMMKGGTIVDATIIDAPSSTKNVEKARDPEMHQIRKGNEWRFGIYAHLDYQSKISSAEAMLTGLGMS